LAGIVSLGKMIGCHVTKAIFLVVSVLNIVIATVKETDKNCNFDETCIEKEDCPSFLDNHKKFLGLRNDRSSQYSKLKKELTDAVCNKKKRAVCCPKCALSDKCIDRNKCEYADEKIDLYKELKKQNKRNEADKIIQELQERICEKEKRFMCCPTQKPLPISSSKLPRHGSCGVSLFDLSQVRT
jgi:hypothetical protein